MGNDRRLEKIRRITEQLKYDPDNFVLLRRRGRLFAAGNFMEQAEDDFTVALSLNPRYVRAYWDRAWVRFRQGYSWDALEDFNEGIRLAPNYSALYHDRAQVLRDLHDFDAAEKDLDVAISLRPYRALYWETRALTRFRRGRYARALQDIRKAIELDSGQGEYFLTRGYLRLGTASAWERALKDFDQAIKLLPGAVDAFYKRGLTKFGMCDWLGAAKDFWYVLGNSAGSVRLESLIWFFLTCVFRHDNKAHERLTQLVEQVGARCNEWPFGSWPEPVVWLFLNKLSVDQVLTDILNVYCGDAALRADTWGYYGLLLIAQGQIGEGLKNLQLANGSWATAFPIRAVTARMIRQFAHG